MKRNAIDSWLERNEPQAVEKLAIAVGVGSQTIRNARNGRNIDLTTAKRLALVLGVSLDELVSDEQDKPPVGNKTRSN